MMTEFRTEFEYALRSGAKDNVLLEIVNAYITAGRTQMEIYNMLQSIWLEYGFDDHDGSECALKDELEFVMEQVWYHYDPKNAGWSPKFSMLPSAMQVLLYTVDGHLMTEEGISLLPGIPSQLRSQPDVKGIRAGTPIELRLPDDTRRETVMASYYAQVPVDADSSVLANLPLILILPNDLTKEDAPVGTEVWLTGTDVTSHGER